MDYFSNQILLPLGGLLIAIFAGWFMLARFSRDEFTGLSAGASGSGTP
jgi:NSS family neurotransmitter:Na+ symporter